MRALRDTMRGDERIRERGADVDYLRMREHFHVTAHCLFERVRYRRSKRARVALMSAAHIVS